MINNKIFLNRIVKSIFLFMKNYKFIDIMINIMKEI